MLEKTFDFANREKDIYDNWDDKGAFKCGQRPDADPFTIILPPPNVTGNLHIGHALNHTLQDILIRFERMRGKDVLWQPGMDHAGIATQMVVERKLDAEGISRHDLGRDKFIERVWEWKEESGGMIFNQMRRLGQSCDWSRQKFTMDDGFVEAVLKKFVDLYHDDLIFKAKRLVNWDPKLCTAISDLEVEQKEVNGNYWHFKYPVDGQEGRFITVATTRPETMLGDVAVAVNADDERYKDLIGKTLTLPIVGRKLIVVADEHADPEKGSGAVKITPAHDFDDHMVGKRHDLENINIFDEYAHLNDNVPEEYRGMERFEARKKIVAKMDELGLLEKIEPTVHMVPYGDRSGVPIEPWLTDQWYVDAETLAKKAISAVEDGDTKFVPKTWEKTYFEWMRNIEPWCVSRQLWWGHQIPAWYGPDGETFVAVTEEEAQKEADAHYGEVKELTRDEDVLDTWFSSALWPNGTMGWPEDTPELKRYYKSDVLVTGFDIIFFWVARMMMDGLYFMKDENGEPEVPFETVYVHALVRDEHGAKMSKSKGNVIDPLELADKYGADALRFTLAAMEAQGRDIKMSDKRVEGYRNFGTKLWNAAKFCEMNECFNTGGEFNPSDVNLTLNKWIIGEAEKAALKVTESLEAFRYNDAAAAAYHFTWGTFCDWFIELVKPQFYADDGADKDECRKTAAWVMDQILKMLHPFMPFVTEELWGKLSENRDSDLILATWPTYNAANVNEAASEEMNWLITLITDIRAARSEMNVPAGAKIDMLVADAADGTKNALSAQMDVLKRLARLENVDTLDGDAPNGAISVVVGEATYYLPLADVIDIDAEKARLGKSLEKLEKEIKSVSGRLNNENFVSKAPAHVIAENKKGLEEAETKADKIKQALERLNAMN
ncbi:valine--tRNA ligase [Pseudemcibacter aquimaris]|uniref:valine--tRNA ligase n=1 Tax=Pseudemcibacter aquimaris TaxID=2857064 RepID=UPI0020113453|nr:valine--tRNA ligase [Pseudemcibacter aquimaris]MCC3859793.1 valine--tRNA ligase [Pseudemcibacter aquimaris]WDU60187.1 valine--tRNA ligase [Pseudemcibacter aquimaris]